MSDRVEDVRTRLRNLGYLSSGVERWFALDPFRSTTFWRELGIVVTKTTVLTAPFALAPILAILAIRNAPIAPLDLIVTGAAWLVVLALALAALAALLALALRSRAELGVEHPRVLTAVAASAAGVATLAIGVWWWGFERSSGSLELLAGAGLLVLFFVVCSLGLAAALLSFTIFETGRIPTIRHGNPVGLLAIAAAVLVALIAVPEALRTDAGPGVEPPLQVPVRSTAARVALFAIDGLEPSDAASFRSAALAEHRVPPAGAASPPERWATIATGVPGGLHGVHSVEGVRVLGSRRILQEISGSDFVLRSILPRTGLATREPLPPSVRQRDYVWEIAAARGVPAAASNWWAGGTAASPLLRSTGQDRIFTTATSASSAASAAERVDTIALQSVKPEEGERLMAVYLPGLDVLERVEVPRSERAAVRGRILTRIAGAVAAYREQGWEVVVVGTPSRAGEQPTIITSLAGVPQSLHDVAPTILDALGFPRSVEMPGSSWLTRTQYVIASYGERGNVGAPPPDEEYYQSLRSLGYIR